MSKRNAFSRRYKAGKSWEIKVGNIWVPRGRLRESIKLHRAGLARRRHRATFIGVTGSSAKSTTAALLAHILRGHGQVQQQTKGNSLAPIASAIRRADPATDYFVLEAAVGEAGAIERIARLIRPDVAIITMIGVEHKSVHKTQEVIAREKGRLVEAVRPGGLAVLNADDERVIAMAGPTQGRVVTFGRENEADYRAVSVSSRFPDPLKLQIAWRGGTQDIATQLSGEYFWLSVTAAVAAASELGVDMQTIAERCAGFEPVASRSQSYPIENGPHFILDTVKAPWYSFPLAIRLIETARAPRKRIVLGHLSDMTSSNQKYRDAYRMARSVCDEVVFVGRHAHRSKASDEDRSQGRFFQARSVRDAYEHIAATTVEGEVILLKSSQNLHLERVAMAFRQDVRCWIDICGRKTSCFDCSLLEHPAEDHSKIEPQAQRRGSGQAG